MRTVITLSLALIFIFATSQSGTLHNNLSENYSLYCLNIATSPSNTLYESFDVYYNDEDGDCVSQDWVFVLYDINGNITFFDSFNENCITDPTIECWTTMDFSVYNCCVNGDLGSNGNSSGSGSGGGGGGGSTSTSCTSDGCYTCFTPGEFADCVIDCASCNPL